MASDRAFTTGVPATAAAQGFASHAPTRDAMQASGGRLLKRAALDARVSTDKQEREETVASQVELLHQTAAAHGYEVLPGHVCIADGISGTRLDRSALDRVRDLAAEGAFEVMLVTTPDRLARRSAYQVVLVEEFTRGGCEVVLAPQSLGTSPETQLRLQRQGVFAAYERALIQERTRRGRVFAARQGRVHWGNPP
jgi:site-specific DNA recombinase